MNKVDWDAVEDAVRAYGDLNYDEGNSVYQQERRRYAEDGFDATMVKIHNEIRKAEIGGSDEKCGAWEGCTLPKGHNMGKPDLPHNHRIGGSE